MESGMKGRVQKEEVRYSVPHLIQRKLGSYDKDHWYGTLT